MSIATVLTLTGQAWARDAEGNLRELSVGDVLQEGETLVTSDNGSVQLDFGDGLQPALIGPDQQVAMSPELDADAPVDVADNSVLDEDIEALLAAIDEDDGDLLEDLEATAAGAGGGGAEGGGHTFVQLARIVETTGSLPREFDSAQLEESLDVEGDGFATLAVADEPIAEEVTPPSLTVSGTEVFEGGQATVSITLSSVSTSSHTYEIVLTNGTADGTDYDNTVTNIIFSEGVTNNGDGTITVAPGVTSFTASIGTLEDGVFEGNETFILTVGGQSSIITILDSDAAPTLFVSDAGDVNEGSTATFDVSLDKAVDADTTLTFTLGGQIESGDVGTPTATIDGQDVAVVANTAGSFSITVPAGTTNGIVISVPTSDDRVFEGREALTLSATLSGTTASGTALPAGITGQGNATIVDTQSGDPQTLNPGADVPVLTVANAGDINEGDVATFDVSLDKAVDADTTLRFTLSGAIEAGDIGTPTASIDNQAVSVIANDDGSYSLTVPAGATGIAISVPTVDDSVFEGRESLTLSATLSGETASGTALPAGIAGEGSATIVDDGSGTPADPGETPDNDTPTITVTGGGEVNEGENASFSVTLSNALETDHDLTIATTLGSAEAGDLGEMTVSYVDADGTTQTLGANTSGSYTVPAGITVLSVSVETTQDDAYEGDETFSLTAGSDLVGNDSAEATIVDVDTTPPIADPVLTYMELFTDASAPADVVPLFFKKFTIAGGVDNSELGEKEASVLENDATLGGIDVGSSSTNLSYQIASTPTLGSLYVKEGDTYSPVNYSASYGADAEFYWAVAAEKIATTTIGGAKQADWEKSGVTVHGYDFMGARGDLLTFGSAGMGVSSGILQQQVDSQLGHRNGFSETIVVDFAKPATQAAFGVNNLIASEGEVGTVSAYLDGQLVGSWTFSTLNDAKLDGEPVDLISGNGKFELLNELFDQVLFDQLRFGAAEYADGYSSNSDSSDYFIKDISFKGVPEASFEYKVIDEAGNESEVVEVVIGHAETDTIVPDRIGDMPTPDDLILAYTAHTSGSGNTGNYAKNNELNFDSIENHKSASGSVDDLGFYYVSKGSDENLNKIEGNEAILFRLAENLKTINLQFSGELNGATFSLFKADGELVEGPKPIEATNDFASFSSETSFAYIAMDGSPRDKSFFAVKPVGYTTESGHSYVTTANDAGILEGGDGHDMIVGGAGNDALIGGAGNDIVYGGAGADTLFGGTGNDTLTGGTGADTFAWKLNDGGTVSEPAVDTVKDFTLATEAEFSFEGEADRLNLADLLVDESAESIGDYIFAENTGGTTTLHISSLGHLNGDKANADQQIVLEDVGMGSKTSDQFLEELISKGQLNID